MGVARDFIDAHGGVRKTAKMFGFPVSTVGDWNAKDAIPHWRWPQIEAIIGALQAANGDAPTAVSV